MRRRAYGGSAVIVAVAPLFLLYACGELKNGSDRAQWPPEDAADEGNDGPRDATREAPSDAPDAANDAAPDASDSDAPDAANDAAPDGSDAEGGHDAFACDGGLTACGGRCVDETSDDRNCGQCGLVCPSTNHCTNRACTCATSLCNGACLDMSTDPDNCGTCGHSCQGASCSRGVCASTTVYSPSTRANVENIAVDSTNVYWTGDPSGVLGCAIAGCANKAMVLGPAMAGDSALVADPSAGVIWKANSETVYRIDVASNTFTTVYTRPSSGYIYDFAVDASYVYVTNAWGMRFDRVNRDTGGAPVGVAPGVGAIAYVWNDPASASMYTLTLDGAISRVSYAGVITSLGTIPNGAQVFPKRIAAAGGNVFIATYGTTAANYADGAVWICPNSGCLNGQATVMAANQDFVSNVTTDGTNVYWPSAKQDGGIMRCSVAGCGVNGPTPMSNDAASFIRAIAVDDRFVYWGDDEGFIRKAPK